MIRLPDKSKCKRKDFLRSLIVGNFIYLEFINQKRSSAWAFGSLESRRRNMSTRPKILKVISKNTMSLVYLVNSDGDWKTWAEVVDSDCEKIYNYHCVIDKPIKSIYTAYNVWSRFQRDEIRHIKSMTKDELIAKYLMELL